MSSHYDLQAIREQPRKRENWAVSLDLVMSRLNALEAYAGHPLSTWYGTDPETDTVYGIPTLSEYAHLRITYPGAAARAYIRERVDYLRQVIGAPVFPWAYTPSLSDFDNEPHRRCGVDAKALLEMLQAIGRQYGGTATYRRYRRFIAPDGRIVNTDLGTYNNAYAYYHLTQSVEWSKIRSRSALGIPPSYIALGPVLENPEYASYQEPSQTLEWSVRVGGKTVSAAYDWVETEGGEYIMLIGASGISEDASISATWHFDVSRTAYPLINQSVNDVARETLYSESYNEPIHNSGNIEPAPFTVLGDGSVSPVVVDSGVAGQFENPPSSLNSVYAEYVVQEEKYISNEYINSIIGNGLKVSLTGGCTALYSGTKDITCKYDMSGTISGWLLWTAPFIPENYTERLAI